MPKYISVFIISSIIGVGMSFLMNMQDVFTDGYTLVVIGAIFVLTLCIFRWQWVGLLLCGTVGCLWGLYLGYQAQPENEFTPYFGERIIATGTVVAEPVLTTASRSEHQNQQVTFVLNGYQQYIRTSLYTPVTDLQQGDKILVQGVLEQPQNFDEQFDYVKYLQRWNIYATLKKPKIIVLLSAGWSWQTPIHFLKQWLIQQASVFPKEEGSLIIGMLIGERRSIPEETANAFKVTGLSHVVAVSGFNMTILATACAVLIGLVGRKVANILTLLVIFGFTILTGAGTSVVRAGIMSGIMFVGQLLGRQYSSLYTLLVVAGIMIYYNPRILLGDIGFQLSVLATAGVLISFAGQDPSKKVSFFQELLRPTLGAIVMTAPIIAFNFQTFSLIAPLANLIVLPLVPWIMLLGALSLLPVVGGAFTLSAQLLTGLMIWIVKLLAKVPYASISWHLPAWLLVFYYLVVIVVVVLRLQKPHFLDKIE